MQLGKTVHRRKTVLLKKIFTDNFGGEEGLNMKEPILVIMAAGMGSRYGGPKQIDPVGAHGEIIIDYSIYDAIRAGFKRVVCIITHKIEADFKEVVGDRIGRICEVRYAYQNNDDLPEGFSCPEQRAKPWGTGHAVLSCRDLIDAPFCVINADDYYGAQSFRLMYDFLTKAQDGDRYDYSMVGFILENTLTENGHVARGVCTVEDGCLTGIHERTRIEKHGELSQYTEDGGETWVTIPEGSTVSMNLWGFTPSIMKEMRTQFTEFLGEALKSDPLKSEFFLPTVVDHLLKAEKARVRVFRSPDRWYGVTYRSDKPVVEKAIAELTAAGKYPEDLWREFE